MNVIGTLGATLLRNLLTGKKAITTSQRRAKIRASEGTIRAGEGTIRAGHDF